MPRAKKTPQKFPFGMLGQDPALAQRIAKANPNAAARKKILTSAQTRFVHELVAGEGKVTQKEAAIRAGFPAEKASKEASAMLRMPAVMVAIQEFRAQLAEKYGTNFERHMRDLQIIRDAALEAGNYGAAVQAEYRRGQALGTIYIERKEIRHGTIDSMSLDEVKRKLQEIKTMYSTGGQAIEDIDVNMIEADDGNDTRSEPVQEDQGESNASESDKVGVEGQPGDPGLFGSFTFEENLDDVRTENRPAWSPDQP